MRMWFPFLSPKGGAEPAHVLFSAFCEKDMKRLSVFIRFHKEQCNFGLGFKDSLAMIKSGVSRVIAQKGQKKSLAQFQCSDGKAVIV